VSGTPRALRADLDADLRAPEKGRLLLAPFVAGAPEERVWEAETALSELLANAVIHGDDGRGAPVRLRVRSDGAHLYVEVEDGGPGFSVERPELPDPTRPTGRGLAIVRRLAERWGLRRRPTRVWFKMDLARPAGR
jgi:anti-sigma regulatory factor (Ser/Thr protein kinase)